MEDPGRLSTEERYRRAIEALIRFDFNRREEDLKWMLAESRRPVRGISWLKERYYDLLQKCVAFPVPFQLIYDLETIASRLFPRSARKFSFLGDPIGQYFKRRLKQYDSEIKRLVQSGPVQMADLEPLLSLMEQKDGRSMVILFLSQLASGKIQKSLLGRLNPDQLHKALDTLTGGTGEAGPGQTPAELASMGEVSRTSDSSLQKGAAPDEGFQEIENSASAVPPLDRSIEATVSMLTVHDEPNDPLSTSVFPGPYAAPDAGASESNAHAPGEDSPAAFESSALDQSEEMAGAVPDDFAAQAFLDQSDSESTSGDHDRDLSSDEAYKKFLLEQTEQVIDRKERILVQSGLSQRVDRAIEDQDEEASVHLLGELHPLAFLSPQERLLRGLDKIQSPLGKIMGHLSEMYRKLNVPDMRRYVDYYAGELEAAGVFENFPAIRERLTNYRNSLVDVPPELLKQVHIRLRQIEDEENDHRKCVELQIVYLRNCLTDDVFSRVWPTIAVILENLIAAELASMGAVTTRPSSWSQRLAAEERTDPRPMPDILRDVEPMSAESVAGIVAVSGGAPATGALSDFISSRTGHPAEDAERLAELLSGRFAVESQAALALCAEVLNAPAFSQVERQAALAVLERQKFHGASDAYRFHSTVHKAGAIQEQRACAESFHGAVPDEWIRGKISGIALDQAQSQSIARLHAFLASKDNALRTRIFQEIKLSPHIPEPMKAVFRKGSDASIVDKCLEGIAASNLSSANKLKLLRILRKMAVYRQWLTPASEEKLNRKIQFYERILAADENLPAKAGDEQRQGFSDEFLESLIQNRMRAARWYARLPDYNREELHAQAALPGKAQVLLGQITKDNAFKKALRHLNHPVDPTVLEEVSAQFPEPEYQASLAKFRRPARSAGLESPHNVQKAAIKAPAVLNTLVQPDASFDRLLDEALLSAPAAAIAAEPLQEDDSHAWKQEARESVPAQHPHAEGMPQVQKPASASPSGARQARAGASPEHGHAQDSGAHSAHSPAVSHASHPHASHSTQPSHPAHPPNASHARRHANQEQHPASAVEGVAASLARGFSSLFSKKAPASHPAEKKPAPASAQGKGRDRKAAAKKGQQAASTLMKSVASYSKGEVFLSEKDYQALEKEMEKHPDSRKLMDDHAYLFKLDHPDPAQFQPPVYVIIPSLKACNHDPAKKKLEMEKIEKAISTAPAKKKPHLQALLTFMERYKTK